MIRRNIVRFLVAWILVFVVWFVGAYLVNGKLVNFMQVPQLWRPWNDELRLYPVLCLSDALLTGAFVVLYVRGLQPKPWLGQGLRYGLLLVPLTVMPMYLRAFVAQPVPVNMLLEQLVGFGIIVVIIGVTVSFVYRNLPEPF